MVIINIARLGEGRRPAAPIPAAKKRCRRPKTMSLRRLVRERGALSIITEDFDQLDEPTLPATRSACRSGPRPCPFVSCRFHLYLDVNPKTGSIKINFPDQEPWDLDVSCALDVAEARGGMSLLELGKLLNLTRERARQLEQCALAKIGDVVGSNGR